MRANTPIQPLTKTHPTITVEDAYQISRAMLSHRLERDREVVVGKKIGVTSDAVQSMLGVFQPDFGFLTNTMTFANKSDIRIAGNMISPRAEGEIAFRLKSTLCGTANTEDDVLAATECIIPCFEIVDSRVENWQIAIQDTIADNASCGVYVLGDAELDPRQLDLPNIRIDVTKNGEQLSSGMGSAVQGNPLTAVAWLANTLGAYGIDLEAGEVILSGSLVPLEPVHQGDEMHLLMTGHGFDECSVSCQFI
ncbi:fumarylacetoacetate hydrolase family protein [Luminiphilus sp.]|nr:fumarylacetoacetate hydrolase family protein [Luminiphilus sp.]